MHALTTSLIVLSFPFSTLFHCQFATVTHIGPIIDLVPPPDVILCLRRPVSALADALGHRDGKRIRAGPRTERDHQDLIAWLSHIQDGRQPDQGCPGIGISDHLYQQPRSDLFLAETKLSRHPLGEFRIWLAGYSPLIILGSRSGAIHECLGGFRDVLAVGRLTGKALTVLGGFSVFTPPKIRC